MLAALGRLTLLWKVLALLGAAGAVGGAAWGLYALVRQQGYEAGEAAAKARCEGEKAAQRKANQEAIDASHRQLLRLADDLSSSEQEIEDALAANRDAALADPTSDRECLPAGSVRRLQTFH